MVGTTLEEKECKECMGPNAAYCDGPQYMGGTCSCQCHVEADKLYEYNGGKPRLRPVKLD